MRGGTSLGDTAGVVYANGRTWTEVRRTSLHILRDFGLGKNAMETLSNKKLTPCYSTLMTIGSILPWTYQNSLTFQFCHHYGRSLAESL